MIQESVSWRRRASALYGYLVNTRQRVSGTHEHVAAVPRVGKEVGRGLRVVEIRVGEHGGEALLLGVGGRQLADAIPVQMFRNVLAIVLRVNLPKGLQVLSRDHLQTAVAAWVAGEISDVENAAHERNDDATLHTRQERSGALDQGSK